jgi:transketolase
MIGAEHSPGFELTTGSFGQALSQAGGIAHARRLRHEAGRVVVFMSDGELEEGQTWEAIQALVFYRLDNVLVYIDVNGQQVDGRTADVMNIEPIQDRITGFGASVTRIDGHDAQALITAQHGEEGRPHFVLCDTDSARGVPLLEARKPHLHYVRFKEHELPEAHAILEGLGGR